MTNLTDTFFKVDRTMKNLWFWLTMSFFLVLLALVDLSRPEMSIL